MKKNKQRQPVGKLNMFEPYTESEGIICQDHPISQNGCCIVQCQQLFGTSLAPAWHQLSRAAVVAPRNRFQHCGDHWISVSFAEFALICYIVLLLVTASVRDLPLQDRFTLRIFVYFQVLCFTALSSSLLGAVTFFPFAANIFYVAQVFESILTKR